MINDQYLSAEHARYLFRYDFESGSCIWLHPTSRRVIKGSEVGHICTHQSGKRYRHTTVSGYHHMVHRLIFLIACEQWPSLEVDHINGNSLDNRWCNLRLVTHSSNCRNRRLQSNNTSGHVGVTWHKSKQRWRAQIKNKSDKYIFLGNFTDINDAVAARKIAEARLEYHANHGETRPL